MGEVNPKEQRGGSTPGEREAAEKGEWAAKAAEGVVPSELGGSDAPEQMLDRDPELGAEALGTTTGSEEPATETGVERSAGDYADATAQAGPKVPQGLEPDLKDATAGPRQSDLDSAG